MDLSNLGLTAIVAMYAFAIGVGDLMMTVDTLEVRRWGRAIRLSAPLNAAVTAVALGLRPDFDESANPAGEGIWFIVVWTGATVILLRLSETKVFGHLLKPTE